MLENAGSQAGRHLLEPLGQVGSLAGEIPEPEIAAPGRSVRRDSRGRARLGACLAASLVLHAVVLAVLPAPVSGRRGAAAPAVRLNLTLGPGPGARDAAASEPSPPDPAPAAPSRAAPYSDPSGTPAGSLPRPGEPAGRGADDRGFPESADPPAVSGAPPKGSLTGSAGTGSASDEAAALLLARVEAALVYPEAARLRGTEGVVGLKIILDGSGALSDLKIARSSGSALLDRAARETVAACLPVPNPSGAPLDFELAVRFTLKKAAAP